MKMVCIKTVRLVQLGERYMKNLNRENTIQNICILDSQLLMLMEKRGHNIYFAPTFWLLTAWSPINWTGILKQCVLNVLEKHVNSTVES